MSVAEYAVIGDLHEVLPAVSAELAEAAGVIPPRGRAR